MLTVFPPPPAGHPPHRIPPETVWIDLFDADAPARQAVAAATGLHVPTRDELSEIETSSRLARRGAALYLSMPGLAHTAAGMPNNLPIGFVLAADRLLTLRFARQDAIETYVAQCRAEPLADTSSTGLLAGLFEALVERIADLLEREAEELNGVSRRVFRAAPRAGRPRHAQLALRALLQTVGRVGDLVSKARETLLAFARLIPFVVANAAWITAEQKSRFKVLRADIASLADYAGHLAAKVEFLMEATVGFIGIEQNNIIRLLTVVSVVGVPPTFLASLWGMNYRAMPELSWEWGYPMALGLIVLSAILPILLFRRRGWL